MFRGITTGLNDAFVIDGGIRARLIAEDPKSDEIIKPFLNGREVKRWRAGFADQYLIKIESSENSTHPWSANSKNAAEKIFAKCYPAVYAHFRERKQGMIERWDQGHYFWELRSCAYWHDFTKPKVVSTKVSIQPTFSLDMEGFYLSNTAYAFSAGTAPLFLLALLNSSVSAFYSRSSFVGKQNGWYEVQPEALEMFPIPAADKNQELMLEQLTRAIVIAENAQVEPLLNGLVYELFFPEDLHRAGIRLFDAVGAAGIARLSDGKGDGLARAAHAFADEVFAAGHPISGMLSKLQTLEVVRIIEGN